MANIEPHISEDEFQFSEADEVNNFSADTRGKIPEEKSHKFTRKNILIAIGVIIIALFIYKLLGVLWNTNSKKAAIVSTPVATQTVPVQQTQPVMPTAPPTTSESEHSQRLEELLNNVNSLTNSVSTLQGSVDSLTSQVQSITEQIQDQQTAIDALKPKIRIHPKIYLQTKSYYKPLPRWYLHAVIPERAWLVQSNGETITVRVGTFLEGYGKIVSISAVKGIVRTSSGRTIKFSK